MSHKLLEINESKKIDFSWFPTPAQCVIYRNWGTVPASKLALVLKTDEATVLDMAEAMGLERDIYVSPHWVVRGYITIIRNNWHLLDYDGICTILDWSRDYLAYMLVEDDFLGIKLGMFKPATPDLTLRPLTTDQIKQTERIKELTVAAKKQIPKPLEPFDFFGAYKDEPKTDEDDDPMFKERIIYSYCALYGDTFASRETVDLSFPDEMLAKYSEVGVNGVWTQAVLSQLAP